MSFTTAAATPESDSWKWWESRRLRYNLALAAAGWVAYGAYAAAVWLLVPLTDLGVDEAPEITLFTTLFQGVLYLIVMGAANVCYLLGPVAEAAFKPQDPQRFRQRAFAMGFWGSVALPFAYPALTALMLLQAIAP